MAMSDSEGDPVVGPVINDKRGKKKSVPDRHIHEFPPVATTKPETVCAVEGCNVTYANVAALPSADELLDGSSTFEKQAAEELARLAAWEELSEDEKQAILAQQAAEIDGTPFAGGGIQTPPNEDAGKKAVLTMFTIVVHLDGTAVATNEMDTSMFEPQYEVDANKIYRAVCEIKKDIESTDAAQMVLRFMNTQVNQMQQRAQAEALAQRVGMPGRAKRH